MTGAGRTVAAMAVAMFAAAAPLAAQNTSLTLGGFNGAFGNSSVANFDAGFDLAGSNITVTVASTSGAQSRRARVYIFASTATIGSLPISRVEWRRTDLGVWTPLSTTPTVVDEQVMGGTPASWSRSVQLRILYPWDATPAQSLAAAVNFRLEVVAP